MSRRPVDDAGAATVILLLITGALLVVGGLVLDGGRAIAGRQHAADIAEQAARAGADALDVTALRATGADRLDADRARRAACGFVRGAYPQDACRADVVGDAITVHVTVHTPTVLLGLIGVNEFRTTSWASARPARGVVEEVGTP